MNGWRQDDQLEWEREESDFEHLLAIRDDADTARDDFDGADDDLRGDE